MSKKSDIGIGTIIVVLCGCMWGLSGVLGQILFQTTGISVEMLTSSKMIATGIILLLFLAKKNKLKSKELWSNNHNIVSMLIFAVAGTMALQYTYFRAISESNAATATVLQYTYPVLMIVYTTIISRKNPSYFEKTAILLAFVGVVFVATNGKISSLSISAEALIWGLASAVAFLFYTVYPVNLYNKISIMEITGWSFLIGGIVLMIITGCHFDSGDLSVHSIALMAAITIIGTLIPFTLYGYGVKKLGNVKASLTVTVEPVFSAIFAAVLLHISFTPMDIVGFTCIIISIWVAACKRERASSGV